MQYHKVSYNCSSVWSLDVYRETMVILDWKTNSQEKPLRSVLDSVHFWNYCERLRNVSVWVSRKPNLTLLLEHQTLFTHWYEVLFYFGLAGVNKKTQYLKSMSNWSWMILGELTNCSVRFIHLKRYDKCECPDCWLWIEYFADWNCQVCCVLVFRIVLVQG